MRVLVLYGVTVIKLRLWRPGQLKAGRRTEEARGQRGPHLKLVFNPTIGLSNLSQCARQTLQRGVQHHASRRPLPRLSIASTRRPSPILRRPLDTRYTTTANRKWIQTD